MPTPDVTLLDSDQARDGELVDELARIVNGAYAIGEAGLWREGATRTTPTEVADAVRGGGMLAASLEGRLVGCAFVQPLGAQTADLGLVSTAPDRWGNGIGGELVRKAEELMHQRGVTTMQLEVLVPKGWEHPSKRRLRDWYTRLGYRVVRTERFDQVAAHLEHQLATPCEFLIFHKPLTQQQSNRPAARPVSASRARTRTRSG
ncbi:MAG TPA: GNAT family N-acetyltransferase [Jatrophihabitantaceae bacterium]|jgi:GNAT superfamily N-acetyltransferase